MLGCGLSLVTAPGQQPDPGTVALVWETLPVTEKGKDEINHAKLSQGVKINQFPGLCVPRYSRYCAVSHMFKCSGHPPPLLTLT